MDRNDQPHDRVHAVRPLGRGDTPVEASGLAQRIWDRYAASPGVISRASTLRLFRRIGRFSGDNLLLLADVRRRWAPMDVLFPRGLSALPVEGRRARLPASSGTPSYAAPLDPEIVQRHAGFGRSTHTVGQPGLQRATSVRPEEKPTALDRPSLAKASRGAIGRPVSLREGMRLQGPAAREGPRAVSVQKVSTDEHRINGWLSRPASASEPERHSHSGMGPALSVDSLRRRQSVDTLHANSLNGYEAPVKISTSDLGATILTRHLSGPAGRAFQRGAALPEPGTSHSFDNQSALQRRGDTPVVTRPLRSTQRSPDDASGSLPASMPLSRLAPLYAGGGEVADAAQIRAHPIYGDHYVPVQRLPLSAGSPASSNRPMLMRQMLTGTTSAGDVGSTGRAGLIQPLPLAISSQAPLNTPMLMRQTLTGTTSTSDVEAMSRAETIVPQTQPGEPDLLRLAEQVSRILQRQLAVERERRGIGRWH